MKRGNLREVLLIKNIFLKRLQIGQQTLVGTPSFGLPAFQTRPFPKLAEHFSFHGKIGLEIAARSGNRTVAQIVTNGRQVNACLE